MKFKKSKKIKNQIHTLPLALHILLFLTFRFDSESKHKNRSPIFKSLLPPIKLATKAMIKHHGGHGHGHDHGHRPPYPPPPPRKSGGGTNLASCVLATLFLVFVVIIGFIVYFSLFKAKDPRIVVNAVQIPSFTVANSSVSFTLSEYVSVKNPNRAVFSHYDSTLQLLYGGNQVGFMYIPAGKVAAGQTEYMAATFAVKSIPISPDAGGAVPVPDTVGQVPKIGDGIDRVSPAMEIESRMEVAGRVRILHFFTHHVAVTADCRIAVAVNDGSVLGFHC